MLAHSCKSRQSSAPGSKLHKRDDQKVLENHANSSKYTKGCPVSLIGEECRLLFDQFLPVVNPEV